MKKNLTILFLLPLIVASCVGTENNSHKAVFKKMIKRPLALRVPMGLYSDSAPNEIFRGRYILSSHIDLASIVATEYLPNGEMKEVHELHLIGILPAGHTVWFERAMYYEQMINNFLAVEHLEGTVDFQGKSYPVYYTVEYDGDSPGGGNIPRDGDSPVSRKRLDRDFVIPN